MRRPRIIATYSDGTFIARTTRGLVPRCPRCHFEGPAYATRDLAERNLDAHRDSLEHRVAVP
jgi:hypothetical protein